MTQSETRTCVALLALLILAAVIIWALPGVGGFAVIEMLVALAVVVGFIWFMVRLLPGVPTARYNGPPSDGDGDDGFHGAGTLGPF